MMQSHEEFQDKMKKRYPPNSLYYLEIAAVKPDTQGMGVGKAIMEWVVSEVGNSPCFLECTDKKNVGFYEKFGFRLVEEGKLVQEGDEAFSTTFYYMVRDKTE
jgi:ribosomal protein S18 acetylase RimI-like enzyme